MLYYIILIIFKLKELFFKKNQVVNIGGTPKGCAWHEVPPLNMNLCKNCFDNFININLFINRTR